MNDNPFTVPVCASCKSCDWPSFATGDRAVIEVTAACFHEDVVNAFSPVTGAGSAKPCSWARSASGTCGPHAALYQAKGAKP